jgi:hypothetical protein
MKKINITLGNGVQVPLSRALRAFGGGATLGACIGLVTGLAITATGVILEKIEKD